MSDPTFSDSRLTDLYSALKSAPVDEAARCRLRQRVMTSLPEVRRAAHHVARFGSRLWWASAAAAAAVVLVLTPAVRQRLASGAGEPGVQIVDIRANGGVHLTWADAGKREYRVLKSVSPADFSRAEEHRVKGTHFVDNDPGSGQVVYYRVE